MEELFVTTATVANDGVNAAKQVSLGQALIYAVIGILAVFSILFLLFVILSLFGKVFGKLQKKTVSAPVAEPAPAEEVGCKLIGVDEKTAAMIMAIVADEAGIAPERLHFEYIKCVEDK